MLVYEHSKTSSLSSMEGGFTPTASMVASGREAVYGPVDRSTIMLWIESGALFSGAVALFITVDDFLKDYYTWIT
jgi:hypothetical protein